MPTAGVTHDITIADSDGTTNLRGYMLMRDRGGTRRYRIQRAETILPRRLTMGELTSAEFPALYALYWAQEDWSGGIGGQIHRLHTRTLAEATFASGATQGVLRPAPDTITPTLDSNPTNGDYVPSGFAVSGEPWAFVGAHPYKWDYSNVQWDRVAMLIDPTTGGRIYRNGVVFEGNSVVSSWADDIGSGGSYVVADVPSRYLHRSNSLAIGDSTAWTMPNGAAAVTPDSFKYFAVANATFWGGHVVDAVDSTNNIEGVTVDTVVSSNGVDSASPTLSITIGTGGSRCLFVGVSWGHASTAITISSVTLGGQTLTSVASATNTTLARCQFFRLIAPATGSGTITVNFSAAPDNFMFGAINCYGVDQTSPVRNSATTTGAGTSTTRAPTTVAGDLGICVIGKAENDVVAPNTGDTERWDDGNGSDPFRGYGSTQVATSTSVTVGGSWTTSTDFAIVGASAQSVFASTSDTVINLTGVSGLAAGDVIRVESELMLVTSVNSTDKQITVVRGYRGTTRASHDDANDIYEMTRNVHHIRSSSDPTALGSWASATTIGDSSSAITGLVGVGTDVVIAKTDGIYRYDAGSGESAVVTELRPELRARRHPDNGKGMWQWNNYVFYPLGDGGLLEVETTNWAIRDISFSRMLPDLDGRTKYTNAQSPNLHGRVVAAHAEPSRMYVLVYESGQTRYHLLMAESVAVGSTALTGQDPDYRWHHLSQLSYTTATDADHAAVYTEATPSGATTHHRVHYGIESTGSNLIPRFLPLSTTDSQFVYEHTNALVRPVTTEWDGNLPDVDKNLVSMDLHTRNLNGGGRTVQVQYSLDGAEFANLGTAITTSAVDGTTNREFTVGTTGKKLTLRFLMSQTSATSTPPEIIDFRVTTQLRGDALDLIPLQLYLADDLQLLNGGFSSSVNGDLTQLVTWNDQSAGVKLTHRDVRGSQTVNAVFLPQAFQLQQLGHTYGRRDEYVANLMLVAVAT